MGCNKEGQFLCSTCLDSLPRLVAPYCLRCAQPIAHGDTCPRCLELGTTTFADTLDELRKEISDAVTLQLDEIERLGFIEEFLRDHSVQPVLLVPSATGNAKFELAGV